MTARLPASTYPKTASLYTKVGDRHHGKQSDCYLVSIATRMDDNDGQAFLCAIHVEDTETVLRNL